MILNISDIDLRLTLIDSAQCFMWREADGGYATVLYGHPVFLKQTECGLYIDGMDEQTALHYLDEERDYDALRVAWRHDPILQRCFDACPGLRVLNQPAWEMLVMGILTANNNVPRIRKLTYALAEHYGDPYETEHGLLYGIPSPEKIAEATEADLRALGTGYRAPYLRKTAQMIVDGFPLESLRERDYREARGMLMRLPGVGGKVADCVLLFGLGHSEALPTDVWVERLLREWYGMTAKNREALADMARGHFGDQAGILQQFLFHAARTGKMEINSNSTPTDCNGETKSI